MLDGLQAMSEMFSKVLTDEHPLIFLLKVGQWFARSDGTGHDPAEREIEPLVVALARSEYFGFRAAGYAMSRLVGRARVRDAFDQDHEQGSAEFPIWLRYLDEADITGCWCGYNEDDLDDVLGVGIRFADGQEGTLVTITEGETGGFVDARLSLVPYAETALSWVDHNPSTAGLSKISDGSAAVTLRQAVRCSDPVDPDGISGRADWVLGWAVIEWVIDVLAQPANTR